MNTGQKYQELCQAHIELQNKYFNLLLAQPQAKRPQPELPLNVKRRIDMQLSGAAGTGKTTLSRAFIPIAESLGYFVLCRQGAETDAWVRGQIRGHDSVLIIEEETKV